jgi:hypothetical protein
MPAGKDRQYCEAKVPFRSHIFILTRLTHPPNMQVACRFDQPETSLEKWQKTNADKPMQQVRARKNRVPAGTLISNVAQSR